MSQLLVSILIVVGILCVGVLPLVLAFIGDLVNKYVAPTFDVQMLGALSMSVTLTFPVAFVVAVLFIVIRLAIRF